MTNTLTTRLGVNSYKDWVAKEGLKVAYGTALNLFEVETADWARYGVKGAVAHFDGQRRLLQHVRHRDSGGRLDARRSSICTKRSTTSSRDAEARSSSSPTAASAASSGARAASSRSRSTRSTGTSTRAARERALLCETTNLPMMMNIFHNEEFIFDTSASRSNDRTGKDEYFAGEGDLQHGPSRATTSGRPTSSPTSRRSS